MSKTCNVLLTILGVWLIISPIILLYPMPYLLVTIILGVILLAVSFIVCKQKEYKPGLNYLTCVLGIVLAAWGVVGLLSIGGIVGQGDTFGSGVNEIITGLLVCAISIGATKFLPAHQGARFYDRGGAEMVDLKGLRLKDNTILMKANLLQSMPSTIYVRPDEVWKVLTMISFDMVKGLPKFLYTGYKQVKAEEKAKQ